MPVARHLLEVLGLLCPLPVLLAARRMQELAPGDLLEIVGDDPAMLEDVPAWCEHAGHRLVEMEEEEEGVVRCLVEKKAESKGQGRRRR